MSALGIALSRIRPGKLNPRKYFDPIAMNELRDSVKARGILQAILVRPVAGEDGKEFEIVAGERRYRAALAEFGEEYEIPALVRDTSEEDAEIDALIENIQREDMSEVEEAAAAQRLLLRQSGDRQGVADELGWNVDKLNRRLALLQCCTEVRTALTEKRIPIGIAELMATMPADKQPKALDGVLATKMSVAEFKERLGRFAHRLDAAIFDQSQCAACPHNSALQANLFAEHLSAGHCTNPPCYEAKTATEVESRAKMLSEEYQVVKIFKVGDGFTPLPLVAEGGCGVGEEQASACRSCASFGCAVSMVPGEVGTVTKDLCFDHACNTRKVAENIKAKAAEAGNEDVGGSTSSETAVRQKTDTGKRTKPIRTTNKVGGRVLQYRVEQWRKWCAREVVENRELGKRVMVALALTGNTGDVSTEPFQKAASKMIGGKIAPSLMGDALRKTKAIRDTTLDDVCSAIPAAAAFGCSEGDLLQMLNFAGVNEEKHFQWTEEFLELFTKAELEAIAQEVGLKKQLGSTFKMLRDGKKEGFIKGLLKAEGFQYAGKVPKVMRYERLKAYSDSTPAQQTERAEKGLNEAVAPAE